MKKWKQLLVMITLVLPAAIARPASALEMEKIQELLSGDEAHAYSVSVDGDTALVGAYFFDLNNSLLGTVYVFVRSSGGEWIKEAELIAEIGRAHV